MMTIEYKNGDMFEEPTEAIVNTVNCVGVMGKGVALEFKRRWPENFSEYKKLCDARRLIPGSMFVFDNHVSFQCVTAHNTCFIVVSGGITCVMFLVSF